MSKRGWAIVIGTVVGALALVALAIWKLVDLIVGSLC